MKKFPAEHLRGVFGVSVASIFAWREKWYAKRKKLLPIVGNEVIRHADVLWKAGRWKRNYPSLWRIWRRMETKWNGIPRHLLQSAFLSMVILFTGVVSWFSLHAEVAKFYPASCLGGWQNTKNAEGVPDLSSRAQASDFNTGNSAVLSDAASQIFCGSFIGEIPKDAEMKTLLVKLSWAEEGKMENVAPRGGAAESIEEAASSTVVITAEENAASSTQQILDAPSEANLEIHLENTPLLVVASSSDPVQTTPDMVPPPVEETKPAPTETPSLVPEASQPSETLVPTEAPPTDSAPISLLDHLFAHALAQGTTTSTTTESILLLPPTSPEFLEVLYTLDGTEWHSLGKVSTIDWKDEFEIPISQWDDISRLQISIRSLPTLDELPRVYLDGMWLEAEYGNHADGWSENMYATQSEIRGLAEEPIEGGKILRFSKKDFRANEEPLFELFTAGDISTTTDPFASSTPPTATTTPDLPPTSTTTAQNRNAFLLSKLKEAPLWFRLAQFTENAFAVHAQNTNTMKVVRIVVTDIEGKELPNVADVEVISGKPVVRVAKPKNAFHPGRYKLHIDVLRNGKILSAVQDFTWGVLAVNTNKSIYLPDETAYLQMAALDDGGRSICAANLRLEVENPSFDKTIFSTGDGTIAQNLPCSANNVSDLPDYFVHYPLKGAGTYHLTFTNLDNGYQITDSFEVRNSIPFEVERVGATRINPFASTYMMTMHVKANQDFTGEIVETVPNDFEIRTETNSTPFHIKESKTEKYIVFDTDVKSGDVFTIRYTYQSPRISPQFYLLGPLRFEESKNWIEDIAGLFSPGASVFEEARQWQIASDAEATIEASVSSTADFHKINPKLIFTSDQVGFMFYYRSGSTMGYASTTDGGATWKAQTQTSALDTREHSVWYDRWTPNNTGNRIHIAYMDATSDDVYYDYVDVNGTGAPTQGTEVALPMASSTSLGVTDSISITQGTDGALYVALGDDTTAGASYVYRCASSCTTGSNWVPAGATPLDQTSDPLRLIPLNNNNIMLLKDDISAEDILSNIYSATSSSWWGWRTIDANAIDSTTYLDVIAPTVDRVTGNVYLAYGADVGGNNIADIRTAIWDSTTLAWTAKTDVLTNSTTTNISIALDQNSGDVYVGYLRGNPGATTTAYYKKSTDDMATWGTETQFSTTVGNLQWVYLNMMSNQRIYGAYEHVTATDMIGNTIADLSPPTFEQASYRLFANANSTDVGATLAATSTLATLTSAGEAFRLRMNIHVAAGDLGKDHQGFKLQFAQKSGTCDTSFSGETYSDVTASSLIAYNDNAGATDGAALTANANDPLHGSIDTLNRQTYVESNNATNTVSRVNAGQDALWDFSLKDNSAPASTAYCFRMATSSDAYITESSFTYTVVPEVITAGATLTQRDYIFLNDDGGDVNAYTQAHSAATSSSISNVKKGERLVARIQIDNTGAATNTAQYRLQWASSTDDVSYSSWYDTGTTTELRSSLSDKGALWGRPGGVPLKSRQVTAACNAGAPTYQEGRFVAGTATSTTFGIGPARCTEIAYAFETSGATLGNYYRLRVVSASTTTAFASYAAYPTLRIETARTLTYSKEARGESASANLPLNATTTLNTSIAIGTDGFPVISYRGGSDFLEVAHCTDVACTGRTITVQNAVRSYNPSIAIGTDGFPVISYRNVDSGFLEVAKCLNVACTGSPTITSQNRISNGGTSLAIGTDGFPVTSYRGEFFLEVAHCTNAACTGSPTITAQNAVLSDTTSLAIGTDGFPVISYQNVTSGFLEVAKCLNAACTGSPTVTVQNAATSTVISLAIGTDGLPVISYRNTTSTFLEVAHCTNAACTGSPTITVQNAVSSTLTSLAIGTDGLPVISYRNNSSTFLEVAKCLNAACTGSPTITVQNAVSSSNTSLAIGTDGFPVVGYRNVTSTFLEVAKCNSFGCYASTSALAILPATSADYDTYLDDAGYTNVATSDNLYDSLFSATSSRLAYSFKRASTTNTDQITVTWEGQVSVSTTTSLQIYNNSTLVWDTIQTNTSPTASTDFTLTGSVANANYFDGSFIAAARLVTGTTTAVTTLKTDRITITFSVVPTLTLVATTDSFATLTPGTPKYATTTLSVTSSGASWNVSMYGNNQGSLAASTTLYLSPTSYSIGIPDSTEWQPGSGTTTAGNAGTASGSTTLAFRVMTASGSQPFRSPTWWGTSDVNLNASQYWAGIASTTASNKRIVISSVAAPSAILGTVQYYLDVPASQQAGAYTGDITFTLTDAL